MESKTFNHTFIDIKCCEFFTVYYSQWQVYSHLNPLELQTHNSFTPFSIPLLERENILAASYFSGVRLCNRTEKKKLVENKTRKTPT